MITIPAGVQIWIPAGVTDLRGVNRRRSAHEFPTSFPHRDSSAAALQRGLISCAPGFFLPSSYELGGTFSNPSHRVSYSPKSLDPENRNPATVTLTVAANSGAPRGPQAP